MKELEEMIGPRAALWFRYKGIKDLDGLREWLNGPDVQIETYGKTHIIPRWKELTFASGIGPATWRRIMKWAFPDVLEKIDREKAERVEFRSLSDESKRQIKLQWRIERARIAVAKAQARLQSLMDQAA